MSTIVDVVTQQPGRPLGNRITAENLRLPRSRADAEDPPYAARWNAAEDRLYPLVMVDPDLYEAAVTLVCQALDVLRSQCGTVAELTNADPAEVLRQCPAASTVAALGLDPGVVFDAACAYRSRDLAAGRAEPESATGSVGSR
jgi:hypothetical protein